MRQDVVFWVGVKSQDPLLQEKHGGFRYLDISKQSWQYWCNKNDVLFYEYSNPLTKEHKATWTRWMDVFDFLEKDGISFDKILVVDGSTIIKWDAPNFFNQCPSGKLTAFRSLENLNWVYQSIEGYKDLFSGYGLDIFRYIDCGFQVFDISHKPFLQMLKEYYLAYHPLIMHLEKTVKKGTDQTIYNYLLQIHEIPLNLQLSPAYNLNHLNRFDWFSYNWQLNTDLTTFFLKYGYIWKFSGFDRTKRFELMNTTWQSIKNNYI